jgi:choline dehydrogenase
MFFFEKKNQKTFASLSPKAADIVIVGAGSAGCVLANRLSADGCTRVVLLEAGGDDRPLHNRAQFSTNLNIHLPAGFARLLGNKDVDWRHTSQPDPGTNGRVHPVTRGRVLGGSSSINGLIYVRGQPGDFDSWRQMGCEGWSWDDVLPYFRRAEQWKPGGSDLRGEDGPLATEETAFHHPVTTAFLDSCEQAGIAKTTDYNGAEQDGASLMQVTVRRGLRQSAAVAYLHPAMQRPNLEVITGAEAREILFDGNRATGIAYLRAGQRETVSAAKEIILCGGAINSPQLLQLSGIGPASVLRDAGIDVRRDSPGVGANLQDHLSVSIRYRMRPDAPSVNALSRGWRLAGQVLRFLARRDGLMVTPGAHATAFVRSHGGMQSPDLQLYVSPGTLDLAATATTGKLSMEREPGCTIGGYQMRPSSTGSLQIDPTNPTGSPKIRLGYLSEIADQQAAISILHWIRKIAAQPALSTYLDHEIKPGLEANSDAALLAHARATGSTAYHPVGTCRMGHQPDCVVDPQLRVHSIKGLRVVDASIMPRLVSGNTNAATIMIAERAADLIRA